MFNPKVSRGFIAFSLPCLLFAVLLAESATPITAQDCQAALGGSIEPDELTNGNSTTRTKRVDEWDGDVLRISTPLPGVVDISGTGTGAQSSLYTEGSTSFHPLVDSAYVGTGLGDLHAVLPAGEHCIQVTPSGDPEESFEIEAAFTDACHLGDSDDYNDSFLCATPIDVDGTASGAITVPASGSDFDFYTFVLTSAGTVDIGSTGTTDVAATLYDANGAPLESDDNDGTGDNFQIVRSLSAGRYYVRVEGVNDDGSYGLGVSLVP